MKYNGLVSIITPNYNCSKFIEETIESVLSQTYQNWEMLIQDDCSIDGSFEIALEYAAKDKRIKVSRNEKNSGAAITRNNALKRAQGKWIAFLDSDDLWASDKLQKQLEFMNNGGYFFSYTKYTEIDENGHSLGIVVSGPNEITKTGMYNYCWPGCLTVMYNVEKIGLIQIEDIKKNNDYAIWLKVCNKANCFLLAEDLAKYRKRSGSISNSNYMTLIKWHWKLYREVEKQGVIISTLNAVRNLCFGVIKKICYVKHVY